MTRKLLSAVSTEIDALIPDNITGLISPLDVRTCMHDILDSTVNSGTWYGSNTPSPNFAITNVGAIPPAPSPSSGAQDPALVTVSTVNRQFTIQAAAVGYSLQIDCNLTVGAANNVDLSLAMYQNGVESAFSAEVTGTGTGNPATMSFTVFVNAAVAGTLDMRLRSLTGNTNVDIINSLMVVQVLPTP